MIDFLGFFDLSSNAIEPPPVLTKTTDENSLSSCFAFCAADAGADFAAIKDEECACFASGAQFKVPQYRIKNEKTGQYITRSGGDVITLSTTSDEANQKWFEGSLSRPVIPISHAFVHLGNLLETPY